MPNSQLPVSDSRSPGVQRRLGFPRPGLTVELPDWGRAEVRAAALGMVGCSAVCLTGKQPGESLMLLPWTISVLFSYSFCHLCVYIEFADLDLDLQVEGEKAHFDLELELRSSIHLY